MVVRQTAPPYADSPRAVYRGQAAEEPAPYGYLPDYSRSQVVPISSMVAPPPPPVWPSEGGQQPGQVFLGAPMFEQPPAQPAQVQLGQPIYAMPVPAGPSR